MVMKWPSGPTRNAMQDERLDEGSSWESTVTYDVRIWKSRPFVERIIVRKTRRNVRSTNDRSSCPDGLQAAVMEGAVERCGAVPLDLYGSSRHT